MDNNTKLVLRKITTTKTEQIETEKYYDGEICLGGIEALVKMAQCYYSLTTADLARACGCERKTIRRYIRQDRNPTKRNVDRILRAIELSKQFRQELSKISLTNSNIASTVTIEPAETQTTEKSPVNQPGGPR